MTLYLGIDGGGSTLRVALTDADLRPLAQAETAGSANPSLIGQDAAAILIQQMVSQLIAQAGITADAITAAGIGIAGAAVSHSAVWLRKLLMPVLPDMVIVPSSDFEIALTGAHGARHGVLLLAGTGSVAYGINADGQALQVGGWGYLVGDEGSGYWIGLEALRGLIRRYDGLESGAAPLDAQLLGTLGLREAPALIEWLYRAGTPPGMPRTRELAALATVVLQAAQDGDEAAVTIIRQAAGHLVRLAETLNRRLGLTNPPVAFAGGLLNEPNPLSLAVVDHLHLAAFPVAQYPPVMGAALLAKLTCEGQYVHRTE